jgi:transposase-like protein
MDFTRYQLEKILDSAINNNGINTLFEIMLNCLMKFERKHFLEKESKEKNKANGFRYISGIGLNKSLKLAIPRDRLGFFYPLILGLVKNQEEELSKLAYNLYAKGLSVRDVSDVFNDLYGNSYSKSTISRMNQEFLEEAEQWRNRILEKEYPILIIDALHSNVRRNNSIETEASYIVMALRKDLTRDIIAIEHIPTESASGWEQLLLSLKKRGLEKVNLIIADGLTGLDQVIGKVFKNALFQKCVVHLKRNMLNLVRYTDREKLAEDLSKVFVVGDPSYTKEQAIKNFNETMNKWGQYSSYFKNVLKNVNIINYLTYLEFDHRIHNMIYTTNRIESLNKQFRKALKIRNSMPSEESIATFIDKSSY